MWTSTETTKLAMQEEVARRNCAMPLIKLIRLQSFMDEKLISLHKFH